MSGVNKAILVGNMGADPEIRYSGEDNAILNFGLATSKTYRDKQGNKQSKTEWHKVVFFGPKAETIAKFTKKGSKLYVEGELATRSWESDGQKRYVTEIVGHTFEFLDPPAQAQPETRPAPSQHAPSHQTTPEQLDNMNFEEDIPFN